MEVQLWNAQGSNYQTKKLNVVSSPVVITVHGNQDPLARATILWDNGLSLPNRNKFVVEESTTKEKLSLVLSTEWKRVCGAELTQKDLDYLLSTVPKNPGNSIGNQEIITWQEFAKDTKNNLCLVLNTCIPLGRQNRIKEGV